MAGSTNQQAIETRYLLGTLSDDERRRFEEAYFHDSDAFAEIEIAEDELVDAYVRKQLSPEDHERFEKILQTSPRLSSRVQFARMLRQRSASQTQVATKSMSQPGLLDRIFKNYFALQPAYQFALTLCAVGALTLAVVLGWGWLGLRSQSNELAAEKSSLEQQKQELAQQLATQREENRHLNAEVQSTRAANEQLSQEFQNAKDQLSIAQLTAGIVQGFTLLPSGARGNGSSQELLLKPRSKSIELKLPLESDDYPSYQVEIRSANRQAFYQSHLVATGPPSARVITLRVQSSKLPQAEYVVNVSGLANGNRQLVADYLFRVKK